MTTTQTQPLQGIHLLSLAVNIPGPAAVARLAQLGARVVKVEPPAGDPLALACPGWYATLHHQVEVIRLNLKVVEDRQRLDGILSYSDLLLTSSRLSALARLKLDWPSLSERHPRLCQVAIVGYPPPAEERAGHDLTYQAGAGLLDPAYGASGRGLPRTVLADLAGAERAAQAALALLLARERGQGAGYLPVSLAEAAAAFAEPLRQGLTAPGGILGGGLPGYNLYPAQRGWVAVAALEPHFLEKLAHALGLAELTYPALAAAFASRPAEEWERWASSHDLPLAAVSPT
ncbi:MAG: CoA transferase [Chloroflexi bacterium]|nr:CoA transferase [Chloroflexota bacterium]MCI0581153.1 CoA transferase [Chloroflexota bacterium]MCI0645377.1 CoA transferase [Chloroflexota bacterium]MCI0727192.1 CoA transferase [Chloroflexota bacterium]